MKKILFVSYGGGHIASCLPVAELLKKKQTYNVYLLALTTANEYAVKKGWLPLGFKDFIESSDTDALRIGTNLMSKEANGLVSKEESAAYLGLSYLDLVSDVGMENARSKYAEKGRQAFLPVRTLKRILERLKPDLLVTTCSPRAEFAALLAAADLGIPSICLLDLPDIHMVSRVSNAPGLRAVCVGNNITKNMLLLNGIDPKVVHVTGNPAFDELRQVNADDVNDFRNSLRANSNIKVLVWASQPEPKKHPVSGKIGNEELPMQIETELRKWVVGRDDIRLVIRYHPSEERNFLPQDNVYLSKQSDDLGILLNASNGIVTMTSTVALQAASLGKPVLSVDLSVFTNDMPLANLGFSIGIPSLDAIPQKLDEWANSRKIFKMSSPDSTCASIAVSEIISEVFKKLPEKIIQN
jgi:hypothetical protein